LINPFGLLAAPSSLNHGLGEIEGKGTQCDPRADKTQCKGEAQDIGQEFRPELCKGLQKLAAVGRIELLGQPDIEREPRC